MPRGRFRSGPTVLGTPVRSAGASLLLFCLITTAALAHDPGLSTATLRVRGDTIAAHLTFARADIERLVPLDADQNGTVTPQEFRAARPRLEALAMKALKLTMDGVSVQAQTPVPQLVAADGLDFDLTYRGRGTRLGVSSELLSTLPRGHRQYVIVRDAQEQRLGDGLFHAAQHTLAVELAAQSATTSSPESGSSGLQSVALSRASLVFAISLVLIGAGWFARRALRRKSSVRDCV